MICSSITRASGSGPAAQVMAAMPEDRKAASYQLVLYTATSGGDLSLRQLDLDKSIAYGPQHRASANVHAEEAAQAKEKIVANTRWYNDRMENGKWRYITWIMHTISVLSGCSLG